MIYKNIVFDDLQNFLTNTLVIDVREINEWKFGHLKEAHLLPLSEITLDKIQNLCNDLSKQNKLDLTQKINLVFYCRSGIRSVKAIQKIFDNFDENTLSALNSFNIFNLKNGVVGLLNKIF